MAKDENKEDVRKIGNDIHSMSFIIGAGFSKNISNKYLSWAELLKDMINEMYAKEMRSGFMNEWEIIDKYGYLGIASEYIRRKGYHEAIDVYIEQRTPKLVEKEDGTYDLLLGDEREEKVDVSLHRQLLDMKVKNIYTFNYDNALDVYSDLTSTAERRTELKNASEEIKLIDDALKLCQLDDSIKKKLALDEKSVAVDEENNEFQKKVQELKNLSIVKRLVEGVDSQGASDYEFIKLTVEKLKQNRQQLSNIVIQLDKYKPDVYYVVKKSGDITISAKRNIFKLHGSLREQDQEYGFDYDNHTQYIIAQEDYDTYHEKHEAFVDLMRISLLKDSYCIIGFSCDDPNFLLWINWVKDIVDKERLANREDANIWNKYFINVDDRSLAADKSLLLNNHYIKVVDLYKVYPQATSRKERLSAFFDDIVRAQSVQLLTKGFWKHFDFIREPKKKKEVKYEEDKVQRIWNLTKDNDLAFFAAPDDYYRLYFLENIKWIIRDGNMNATLCKALMMAVNQNNIPLEFFIENNLIADIHKIVLSSEDEELKRHYNVLTDLDKLLKNEREASICGNSDRDILYNCVNSLFNFDFDGCVKILNGWKPKGGYYNVVQLMIGAGLRDKRVSLDEIFVHSKREQYNSDSEYLIALELLLSLQEYFWGNQEAYARFENLRSTREELIGRNNLLTSLSDYFSTLLKAIKKEEKVIPLGREGRTLTFANYNSGKMGAIRILYLLSKLGFVTRKMLSWGLSDKSVFDMIESIYIDYPFPCLYYASLCTDKNMSRRVAQLYCNSCSDKIQKTLPDLLVKIMEACGSKTLSEERKNVLYIYAESFIKRVPQNKWVNVFKRLYTTQNLDCCNEREIYNAKYNFTEKALVYSSDIAFKQKIIGEIFDKWDTVSQYDNSLIIATIRDVKTLDKTMLKKVYAAMNNVNTEPQVFILFNLQKYIPRNKFNLWVQTIDEKLLSNPSLIIAVSYAAKNNKRMQQLALRLLGNSLYLWNTGIQKDKEGSIFVTDAQSVDIDRFEQNVPITGDTETIVFEKLKNELELIDMQLQKQSFSDWFTDWSSLIYSMKLFLLRHKQSVTKLEDVDQIIRRCDDLYFKASGQVALVEKIIHPESYKVEEGVIELFDGIRTCGANQFKQEYDILANLIIQHQTKALDICLRHFSWSVTFPKHQKFFISNGFVQKVALILRAYRHYFMGNDIQEWDLAVNKDVAERCLLDMNEWLKSMKQEDSEWAKYKPIYFHIEE